MASDHPYRPLSFNTLMTDLLRRAGVDKSSVIRVTGRGGLAVLLWLCRHGYDQVGYVRRGRCPSDSCDLLMVLHDAGDPSLAETLEQGPHLRDGGVLVVQSPAEAEGPVDRVLDGCGFHLERRLRGRHSALHVARRQAPPLRRAA